MAAVFFDIDGTLLDRKEQIEPRTAEAIRLLQENGHQVYINSGRTKVFIRHPGLLKMGFDGFLCGCGTNIWIHGKEILYHTIDLCDVREMTERFYQSGMMVILEGRDKLYVDKDVICRDPYGEKMYQSLASDMEPLRDNPDASGSKFTCVIAGCDYQTVADAYADRFDFLIHDAYAMEVVPRGFSKARAMEKVCELTKVPREDTFAFGDGSNDVEMLQYAGIGISMGNGSTEAKENADYITADIHSDGIFKALKHFDLI